MKMKLALASLLVFVFCESVFAQVTINTSGGGGAVTTTSSPINQAIGGSNNAQGGTSSALGGSGGQGGTSSAITGSSSSSGNTSGNTTINSNYSAPKIPVATAYAPSNFPTAPCMGSSSVGVSGVLLGFSMGSSWEATECMIFEAARSFDQAGMSEDALAIKCTSKYSAAAPSCIKLLQQKNDPRIDDSQIIQYQQPIKVSTEPIPLRVLIESTDSITGFKTTIDTRDAFKH
ncbi:hypothetical protein G6686_08570 [Polynucleobacter paneuropaeus]|nr:hypothetical protein G6686_08570 [Polynucleobacter paneuropaeus]